MEQRTPQSTENEFIFPDGTRSWFELRFEPVPEGVFTRTSSKVRLFRCQAGS